MKKLISLLVLLITLTNSNAQINIVSNGDFETYTTCPTAYSQTSYCTGWRQYTSGTSDYLNSCSASALVGVPVNTFGYQYAASGNGYLGGYSFTSITNPTAYTEYVAGSIAPLVVGSTYEVSMSVSLSNQSKYANNGLGMWFYVNGPLTLPTSATVTVTPQLSFASYGPITDTQNWVRLTAKFVADSAYTNLVIGKFTPTSGLLTTDVKPSSSSGYSYYYYDSVWIRILGIDNLYMDSSVCIGDTFSVPYRVSNGTTLIFSNNVYTVELSDPSGSFTSGTTVIGSLPGTALNSSIKCVVPPTVSPGNNYYLRIVSSNSHDSSAANVHKIAVGIYPENFKAHADMPLCKGSNIHLYATTSTSGVTYAWTGPNSFTSSQADNIIPNADPVQHNGKYVVTGSVYNCATQDAVDVVIEPQPDLTISGNSPICVNNIITLNASSTLQGSTFTWTGPCGYISHDAISKIQNCTTCNSGTYTAEVEYHGCKATKTIDIKVVDAKVDLGPDEVLCMNETRLLKLDIANASFLWQDGGTSAEFNVTQPGKYWVTANTECGLLSDTVVKDYEICECKPFVPNAFTPNNDNRNDNLGVTYIDCKYTKLDFIIINRFGEVVFKTNDIKIKWDGMYKGMPADLGTYFYQLKFTGPRNRDFLFKGDVALIR